MTERQQLFAQFHRDACAHAQALRLTNPGRVLFMGALHLSQVTGTSALAVVSQQLVGAATQTRVESVETFKGTAYTDIVLRAKEVMNAACPWPELRGFGVDFTVTGDAIGELFDAVDLAYCPHTIEEGDSGAERVSLKNLVTTLQRLIQGGRFQIRTDAPGVDGLLKELRTFEVAVDGQRHTVFKSGATTPARILAVCLAVWDLYWYEHMLWPELTESPEQRAARAHFAEGY